MSEPFLGEIRMVGFNFAPRGWALCNGQIMAISTNTALFSLLGTTYGGNGQTTFGLPNLQGRFPMHAGSGPGLSPRTLGEMSGTENVTIINAQMPMHTHPIAGSVSVPASSAPGTASAPASGLHLGQVVDPSGTVTDLALYNNVASDVALAATVSLQAGIAGGSQPLPIMNPFLVVNFIIATEGIFPSRN
jgi:microcystin-dependent protein